MKFYEVKMRPKSFLILVISLYFVTLLSSCISTKPTTDKIVPDPDMKYLYQVKEGDELEIEWSFENAHRVKVEGFAGSFLPEGSVKLRPQESQEIKITAYKGFSDSLVWTAYIEVIAEGKPNTDNKIMTGAAVLTEQIVKPSIVESEFLNGIIAVRPDIYPDEMRIVRVKRLGKSTKAEAYILLMDKLGNFIAGYGEKRDSVSWNATNSCALSSANYSNLPFKELSADKQQEYVDFAILIDNSGFADNKNVKESLKSFIKGMNPNDKVMVSAFNHRYLNIFDLVSPETAVFGFDDMFVLPKASGFNAANDAMIHAIKGLQNGKNKNRALVLITYSNDNASLLNKIENVIKQTEISNVSVYVIGIGDAIDTYPYRYVCSATGGKYYILLNDEVEKFKNVLNEILFTYRNSYKVSIPLQSLGNNCEIRKTKLSFTYLDINLKNSIVYPGVFKASTDKKIILAGFDKFSSNIDKHYYDNLNRVAAFLRKNSKKYYITAYSHDEGDAESSRKYAELRAEAVKNYLVGKGVDASLLFVRTLPEEQALYTYTNNKWLKKLNRRVEFSRYKIPEQIDYELITSFAVSETEAASLVNKWTERGFKSYYLRTRTSNGISYKVMLWGFKSEKDAQTAADNIKKKYNEYVMIDKKY